MSSSSLPTSPSKRKIVDTPASYAPETKKTKQEESLAGEVEIEGTDEPAAFDFDSFWEKLKNEADFDDPCSLARFHVGTDTYTIFSVDENEFFVMGLGAGVIFPDGQEGAYVFLKEIGDDDADEAAAQRRQLKKFKHTTDPVVMEGYVKRGVDYFLTEGPVNIPVGRTIISTDFRDLLKEWLLAVEDPSTIGLGRVGDDE